GIQNHSGRPTSPSAPRGGAVPGDSAGNCSSLSAWISSCSGVTRGAPELVLRSPAGAPEPIAPPRQSSSAQASPGGGGQARPRLCACAWLSPSTVHPPSPDAPLPAAPWLPGVPDSDEHGTGMTVPAT